MTVQPRKIAVVGRNGQVARSLAEHLARTGHTIIMIARPDADLADADSVQAAIARAEPELVVNAAAYTAVDRAEDEPDAAFAINAEGAGAVARAAADVGAPIIHFSTDYVFDGMKAAPYREEDPCAPKNVYGRSKLRGEELVAAANPRHVILRTAWVCSPYGTNFMKTMLRLAAERPELKVVADQHGSPTFAADLAVVIGQLVPRLLDRVVQADDYGVFHAVNAGEATWCEFARTIMSGAMARGAPAVPVSAISTKDYPTKARRPMHSLLSTDKLGYVHGITLRNWESALDDCLTSLLGPVEGDSRPGSAHLGVRM